MYEWELKVLKVIKIRPGTISEIKDLIEAELPHSKVSRGLREVLQKQFECAAKLEKFYHKCKREKPTNGEVEAIRENLKGFKVLMPKKIKLAKDLIHKSAEIKKAIDDFYYKSRPDVGTIEVFYGKLCEEPVAFEDCLKDLKKISEKCHKLIKRSRETKKGHRDVTKLIKYYKKLNVTCQEFEDLIKEKKLDTEMIGKLENELADLEKVDLDKLLTVEAQIEMVDDEEWCLKMKSKIFETKIALLKTAYEGGKQFKIDLPTLKSFMVEGYQLCEKLPELVIALKLAEDIWKRVKNKLEQLKTLKLERLQRIKKILYNCIDVKQEVDDLIHKLTQEQAIAQTMTKKVPLINEELPNVIKKIKTDKHLDYKKKSDDLKWDRDLGKLVQEDSKPKTLEERLKAGKNVKDSKKEKLLKMLESNPTMIENKQKEKKDMSALELLNKRMKDKQEKRDRRDKRKAHERENLKTVDLIMTAQDGPNSN